VLLVALMFFFGMSAVPMSVNMGAFSDLAFADHHKDGNALPIEVDDGGDPADSGGDLDGDGIRNDEDDEPHELPRCDTILASIDDIRIRIAELEVRLAKSDLSDAERAGLESEVAAYKAELSHWEEELKDCQESSNSSLPSYI